MGKTYVDIPEFSGINKLHTRKLGEPSSGKNFWTKSGVLFTRDGLSIVPSSFTNPIKSIHSVGKSGLTTRLLVQEGSNLWHRISEGMPWQNIKSDCKNGVFSSCQWNNYLIIVNGMDMLAYDINAATISPLQNTDGGSVPKMEYVTAWKGFIFGWAPHYSNSHYLWFNGYEKDSDGFILGKSKDVWPADFFLAIGNGEAPILSVIPYNTHLFVLTKKGNWRIYGHNEDNFEVMNGGNIGSYNDRVVSLVGDYVIWVGTNKRVYVYSGTQAEEISQPIDEILRYEDFGQVFSFAADNRYWLVFPGSVTKAYVFDLAERAWYIHEFPAKITSACLFGEYMQKEQIHFGFSDSRIAKMDSSQITDFGNPITTEFVIGPFDVQNRDYKIKRISVNAEPRNDFELKVNFQKDVYSDEIGPYFIRFEQGPVMTEDATIHFVRGKNLSMRISSTDRVDEMQKITLYVMTKDVM